MKILFLIITVLMNILFLNASEKYTVCYDIHEMIKYTNVYRHNLSFDKSLKASGYDFDVYQDFILVKEFDKNVLTAIAKDSNNFINKEISLDTNSIEILNTVKLDRLNDLLDSNSTIRTIIFQSMYKDYFIIVEVYNVSPILSKLEDMKIIGYVGFDISKFHAYNRFHLFKCHNKGGLDYIGSYISRFPPCF
jgi:hypothetical protein